MAAKTVLILVNHEVVIYNFRKEFVAELLKNKNTVYISSPNGEKIDELVSLGCIHIEAEIDRRGINPLNDLKLLICYREIIKKLKPDIIYSYTIKPNIYGGFISRVNRIPFVATITGLGSSIENNTILTKIIMNLYKISLKKARTVFFQNTRNFIFFKGNNILEENQMKMVAGSGVNLKQFRQLSYPESEREVNFVFIGRLMKEKGITELFEAAKHFKNTSTNIEFHILGFLDDNLEEELQQLIKEEVIIYHGPQSDIRPFLEQSHAIIHPSYHEGLSNVLLEAAASGRPIIASDIPGCRETFDEGITGFGFQPKSTSSLIEAIEKFIDLPRDEKEKMGILGREKIEREFNRKQVVDAYIKEINNIKQ